MNIINYIIETIKILAVLLFIAFELIAWEKLGKPTYNKIRSLKIMDRFKLWISIIEHRYLLLIIFLTPFIFMEIASLMAISALAKGLIVTGIGLYTIKLLLTAPVVIIFNVSKKILVTFPVIKYSYGMILNLKRSSVFRQTKKAISIIKTDIMSYIREFVDDNNPDIGESFKKIYINLKNIN